MTVEITNYQDFLKVESHLDLNKTFLFKNGERVRYEYLNYFSDEIIKDLKEEMPNEDYSYYIGEGFYYDDENIFVNGGVVIGEIDFS